MSNISDAGWGLTPSFEADTGTSADTESSSPQVVSASDSLVCFCPNIRIDCLSKNEVIKD
ncbi:hypothetical protein [Endozoicomonas euniceicola]|uniref:Uncharacterized protein n=1 Tax=Endozoicomonas euniceicola TaxID=1234143 RepID=A0ABY6GN65_9GAMM|nr:hypothetical protein [Endozoicomonas euniceicola]UYM14085.1 hypothetical protein NX720_14330 [Endozoicomonas euniceicola]